MSKPKTIDEYIDNCPKIHQNKLYQLRDTIKSVVPEATEKISYNMPTFHYKLNLVHFALHKNHIGFYPLPNVIDAFKSEFKDYGYTFAKGSVQFPNDEALPIDLIKSMVLFRLGEVVSEKG